MAAVRGHLVVPIVVVLMLVAAAALWPSRDQRLPVARPRLGPGGSMARAGGSGGGNGGGRHGGARHGGASNGDGRLRWLLGAARQRWRATARLEARERSLAELAAALAAPLRAGVPPAVAIMAAAPAFSDDAALGPLLLDLSNVAAQGGPAAEVWRRHAQVHASPDLSFIGQAWALSELTGAPLADALACGEQVLRARARGRARLSAAAAGPRASMAVLCVLPASGPVVGMAMGVDPVTLYFSSPLATGGLVVGIVLALGAWLWSRRILRAAG